MAFQTTSPNPPSESIASGRLSPPLEHGVVYAEHRRNEEGHQLHRSPQLYARDSKEEAEADQAASTLLSLDNETTEEAPRTKSIQRISLWQDLVDNWKWELAACIFSAACFLAIALVLATQANKPLANWNLAVSPNATISFSATLATSAFLMVLSAILSQLKWIHFTGHAHSLDQLEHFDLAGRGPLGSLMFLAKYHHGTLLPSFASLLVLICLLVGPFVQLVLSFPTLTLPDPNVEQASFSTATLYDPDNYISDPWDGVGFQGKSCTPSRRRVGYSSCRYSWIHGHKNGSSRDRRVIRAALYHSASLSYAQLHVDRCDHSWRMRNLH